jgi:hypothetical protein
MVAPDGAASSAAEMVGYFGEAQLVLFPGDTVLDTHSDTVLGVTAGVRPGRLEA